MDRIILRIKNYELRIKTIFVCCLLLTAYFSKITLAQQAGASLFLEPSSGTFVVNSTFSVSVFVNTNGRPINAVEVDLKFPPDKLQVVSPTTNTSFFKVWLGIPTFSNADGTINLKGGVPSPGIITTKGLVTTITFRVKSTGRGQILFTDESKILADDGQATDILINRSGGIFNLILPPPAGPTISSPTHSDQTQWSRQNSPTFNWNKDDGVSGFSYVLNNEAIDTPDDIADGVVSSVQYENIEDGQWFFHLKAYSTGSGWGGTSHYQILVDKTSPAQFSLAIEPKARTMFRRPSIGFITTDNASGLDHYEIKILRVDAVQSKNKQSKTPFFVETTSPYQTPELELGRYDVLVRAYDKAGNFTESEADLKIVNFALEPFSELGFNLGEIVLIPWWIFWSMMGVLVFILLGMAIHFWRRHRSVKIKLAAGVWKTAHPVSVGLERLREMQENYQS